MSDKAIKFMNGVTLDAMSEQDARHPNRKGERNQRELDDIVQEMLNAYPRRFLVRIGVVEA